jgi:hypothetical protein
MSIRAAIMRLFHRAPAPASTARPVTQRPQSRLPMALPIARHAVLPEAGFAQEYTPNGLPIANQLPEVTDYGTYTPSPDAGDPEQILRWTNPEMAALVGHWIPMQSSWIMAIRFDPYPSQRDGNGDMSVEYTDGFVALFQNTTSRDFLDFYHSPSHGKWMYSWSRKSDYTTVRGQLYHGAALQRRVDANK